MIRINYFLFVTFFFALLACKNVEGIKIAINNNKKKISEVRRYAIGKGGGFTKSYEEFIFDEDGRVFKMDFNYDREVFVKELNQVDLNYFLEKIESIDIEGMQIDEPGNLSYYIEIREGYLSINKLIWGNNSYYPPEGLEQFHKELFDKLAERD